MKEMIEKNHQEALQQLSKKWNETRKKEQRREKILTVAIILLTIGLIAYNTIVMSNAVDNCIKDGNSKNYCIEKLG